MLALEGVKILDLSRVPPGAFCTMILGDMGADVLKIETPGFTRTGLFFLWLLFLFSALDAWLINRIPRFNIRKPHLPAAGTGL
ncbi:MAG: CoA transferase, partial [Chloroflexota bacterium]|nr:CoA transferase [Chloroflexota bacterium]